MNLRQKLKVGVKNSLSKELLDSMETLTLIIQTQLATRARQVAEQRHTTVDSLVTEFLSGLPCGDETQRQEAAQRLVTTIDELQSTDGRQIVEQSGRTP